MSSYKRNADGFRIDVASGAPQGKGILLTDADLAAMGGVKPIVIALRKAFKNQLAPAVLTDGAVFLAHLTDGKSLPLSAARVISDMSETVADLEQNASKEHPAPIEHVTKSSGLVDVLETAADSFRKHSARLVVEHQVGHWEVPTLDPSVFVRPDRPETLEMEGTYIIRGFERDEKTNGHLMHIGASKLAIALPLNNPEWAYKSIWWTADIATYLIARLQRTSRHSYWEVIGEAKLVRQGDLLQPPEA